MQVVIGKVGRAHGVRGEVAVEVRTDEPERRFAPGSVLCFEGRGGDGDLTVTSARPHSGRLLVRFEQVDDRSAAEALRGATLSVEVDQREHPEDPEEYYDHQLVGLEARTGPGDVVGAVAEVLHLPAQDTLSITTPAGGEVLVPFVADLVPEVHVDDGYLVVADVPGLLDPDTAEPAGG
ncbi:MAG: ribosome maturation factor RimM [Nocardioidaceae bacterium]